LVRQSAEAPEKSFPALLSEKDLEGDCFSGNESVEPAAILVPHVLATLVRVAAEPVVLAVQDTTTPSLTPRWP
jgi:hypothetical protein